MPAAHISVIVGRDLNRAEQEKLDRLDAKLTSTFIYAGYSDVRLCVGTGEGEHREMTFQRGLAGDPLLTFTSVQFLLLNGDQLSHEIVNRLRGTSPS